MSNDLISKELFLKEIDEVIAQYNWEEYGIIMDILECVRDMVFDHPIAYDIDRVIERLEETFDRWGAGQREKDIMLEIVKRGGEQE